MNSQNFISKQESAAAIQYLQQEHTKTLKSLHEEIERLQKKCSGKYDILSMYDIIQYYYYHDKDNIDILK